MGHIKVKLKIANWEDIQVSQKGRITSDKIREVEIDGLVDTGATGLNLPNSIIQELGLAKAGERVVRAANGSVVRNIYGVAWVTIMGRSYHFGAIELPDDCPPLIGVTVLEELDLTVNPLKEILELNPEHGGDWVSYAY